MNIVEKTKRARQGCQEPYNQSLVALLVDFGRPRYQQRLLGSARYSQSILPIKVFHGLLQTK